VTVAAQACYIYGIVPAGTTVPVELAGVEGAPVELVEHDDLAAVVSGLTAERPLGKRADLVAHSEVLDAFAREGAVVPVRFGSVLPDTADVVAELLAPNVEHFLEVLEQVAGCAQFNLRARYDEEVVLAEVVAEHPEIAELREQTRDQPEDATYYARVRLGELVSQALSGRREIEGSAILEALLPHAVAYNVREGEGVDHLLDVAFLVRTEQREAFEAEAEDVAARLHDRARLRLLGPLAPYDFVPEG